MYSDCLFKFCSFHKLALRYKSYKTSKSFKIVTLPPNKIQNFEILNIEFYLLNNNRDDDSDSWNKLLYAHETQTTIFIELTNGSVLLKYYCTNKPRFANDSLVTDPEYLQRNSY